MSGTVNPATSVRQIIRFIAHSAMQKERNRVLSSPGDDLMFPSSNI